MKIEAIAELVGINTQGAVLDYGDEPDLANRLIEDLGGNDNLGTDEDRLYRFDEDLCTWSEVRHEDARRLLFTRYERASVRAGISKNGQPNYKPMSLSSRKASGTVRVALDKIRRRGFMDLVNRSALDSPGVLFQNGWRSIDGHLSAPDRDAYVLESVRLPIAYSDSAMCPEWMAMLRRIWPPDLVELPDFETRVGVLQEFFGAALFGMATRFQKVLLLVGSGANGKSVVVKTMERLFPIDACTSVPIQRMADPYYAELLLGSRVNLVGELPSREVFDTSDFKGIVDGGLIVARRIREAPISFHPITAHVFSANSLPQTSDSSDGFWRRFLALNFPRRFKTTDPDYNPDVLRLVHAELPGIARWAVDGAVKLDDQRRYTSNDASDAVLTEWRRESNSVALFVHERCTIDPDAEFAAGNLYRAYRTWCDDSGLKPFSIVNFGKRVQGLGVVRKRIASGNTYGIDIKTAVNHTRTYEKW